MRGAIFFVALLGVAASPAGDLYQPAYCLDRTLRGPSTPYVPQAGDMVFYNYDGNLFWKIGYKIALAGPPDHSGIVVKLPDGTFGVLEAGPDDSLIVEVCAAEDRLKFHSCHRGPVWIRRRICPISDEENKRLTEFAISERNKEYAVWRLLGQGTLLRSRGPIRTNWMGKSAGPKESYFCSEVVLEAAVYAGLLDAETTRPRATYPEDFFFDRSRNPYINKHLSLAHAWHPPQRLTFEDCPCCKEPKGSSKNPNPAAIPVHPYFLTSQR
ncbi:MAG: hypothetical protein K1X57_01725 [Gemmataceae bacterium]|nr:hypothetical protein [Gemmataceae bacterium]